MLVAIIFLINFNTMFIYTGKSDPLNKISSAWGVEEGNEKLEFIRYETRNNFL